MGTQIGASFSLPETGTRVQSGKIPLTPRISPGACASPRAQQPSPTPARPNPPAPFCFPRRCAGDRRTPVVLPCARAPAPAAY